MNESTSDDADVRNPRIFAALTDEALIAFWEVILKHHPDATTGDLSLSAATNLSMAAESAIQEWIVNNVLTKDQDVS